MHFLQIQTAFLSGHGKGRNTFFTVVCYLTKNENTDILVNPGSADPVSGAVNRAVFAVSGALSLGGATVRLAAQMDQNGHLHANMDPELDHLGPFWPRQL